MDGFRGWRPHSGSSRRPQRHPLRQSGAFCPGWERGLGKTIGTCVLIDELAAHDTLVVCPNTAKRPVWEAELGRFLPTHEVVVLGNTAAQRNRALGYAGQLRAAGHPFVLVVHYEALAVIAGKGKTAKGHTTMGDGWRRLGEWDLLVTDEDHRLSNSDTQMRARPRRCRRGCDSCCRARSSRTTWRS